MNQPKEDPLRSAATTAVSDEVVAQAQPPQKKEDPLRLATTAAHAAWKQSNVSRLNLTRAVQAARKQNALLYKSVAKRHAAFLRRTDDATDKKFFNRDGAPLRRHWLEGSCFEVLLESSSAKEYAYSRPHDRFQNVASSSSSAPPASKNTIPGIVSLLAFIRRHVEQTLLQKYPSGEFSNLHAMLLAIPDSAAAQAKDLQRESGFQYTPRVSDKEKVNVMSSAPHARMFRVAIHRHDHLPSRDNISEPWQRELLDSWQVCNGTYSWNMLLQDMDDDKMRYVIGYRPNLLPRQADASLNYGTTDLPLLEESYTTCERMVAADEQRYSPFKHRQTIPLQSSFLKNMAEVHKHHIMERILAIQLGCCKLMHANRNTGIVQGDMGPNVKVRSCNFKMIRTEGEHKKIGCELQAILYTGNPKEGAPRVLATTYYWLHQNLPHTHFYLTPELDATTAPAAAAASVQHRGGFQRALLFAPLALDDTLNLSSQVGATKRPGFRNNVQQILGSIDGFKSSAAGGEEKLNKVTKSLQKEKQEIKVCTFFSAPQKNLFTLLPAHVAVRAVMPRRNLTPEESKKILYSMFHQQG